MRFTGKKCGPTQHPVNRQLLGDITALSPSRSLVKECRKAAMPIAPDFAPRYSRRKAGDAQRWAA